jgi:hypothetical protein
LSGNIDVRGRPVQQKFGRTGKFRGGTHQRHQSHLVLGIWVGTSFQEELKKSRLVTLSPLHAQCNGVLTTGDTCRRVLSDATEAVKAAASAIRLDQSLEHLTAGADEKFCESRVQLHMEQRLNQVGRERLLASSQTARE